LKGAYTGTRIQGVKGRKPVREKKGRVTAKKKLPGGNYGPGLNLLPRKVGWGKRLSAGPWELWWKGRGLKADLKGIKLAIVLVTKNWAVGCFKQGVQKWNQEKKDPVWWVIGEQHLTGRGTPTCKRFGKSRSRFSEKIKYVENYPAATIPQRGGETSNVEMGTCI